MFSLHPICITDVPWIINDSLDFEGAGRGAVAIEDLSIGDTALEIPESLIVSEDVLCESDMVFCCPSFCLFGLLYLNSFLTQEI